MDRRTALSLLAGGATLLLGALMGIPVLGRFLAPLRGGSGERSDFFPVGRLEEFPKGRPTRVTFPVTFQDGWVRETVQQAAWVVRDPPDGDEPVKVFSTVCPHLGCSVKWMARAGEFECPCHESAFAAGGARLHGPARRGLDELPVEVVAGELRIRWVEYVPGTDEKKPLGGSVA